MDGEGQRGDGEANILSSLFQTVSYNISLSFVKYTQCIFSFFQLRHVSNGQADDTSIRLTSDNNNNITLLTSLNSLRFEYIYFQPISFRSFSSWLYCNYKRERPICENRDGLSLCLAFGWSSHWLRVAESNANEPNVESMVNFYYDTRIHIYIIYIIYNIYIWMTRCTLQRG